MEISVIVPVYNGEKYIDRFFGFLNSQHHDSFEVIFINDGSTDGSGDILQKLTTTPTDFPIRVFHQKNSGQGSARNKGIKTAKGKYIYFADIDDEISEHTLEHLSACEGGSDYDFIVGNTSWIDGYGTEFLLMDPESKDDVITGSDSVTEMLADYAADPKDYRWFWTVWNKLYKRSLIIEHNLFFDETMRSLEDVPYVIRYLSHCQTVYLTKKVLYRYFHCGQENYASSWQTKQPLVWKKQTGAFADVLAGRGYDDILTYNYCEYAIWAMFRLCLMAESLDEGFDELESAIETIVSDQGLQENIHKYRQKHDDNDPTIPNLIKKHDTKGIINAFHAQINKRRNKAN